MKVPMHSGELVFVPVSFQDRDMIVGRLMEIIEAAMPESKQQDAVKSLIKQRISEYFTRLYNDAFTGLKGQSLADSQWHRAVAALWKDQIENPIEPGKAI